MNVSEAHWDAVYAESRDPRSASDGLVVYRSALDWFGGVRNKSLLDIGCGDGAASVFFAQAGALVTAIDTSVVAIDNLAQYCVAQGVKNVHPVRCSAFEIADLGRFDCVYGGMILHHLEPLDAFVDALSLALLPRARAIFFENNAANPLLMWCRRHLVGRLGVPRNSDSEESPLEPDEVQLLKRRFEVRVLYNDLMLIQLASHYLLHGRLEAPLKAMDRLLYRLAPALRPYGYRQLIAVSKPG